MSGKVLLFPSDEALIAALSSDLIPVDVQRQPARVAIRAGGALAVYPDTPLPEDVLVRLRAAGVATGRSRRGERKRSRAARVWPELISPRRRGEIDVPQGQTVLFYMDAGVGEERSNAARSLLDLSAELLRLGCDRCSYQLLGAHGADGDRAIALLRAFDPPYYTVAACGDKGARYRAFVPLRSGQTRTWIELGYQHPLAAVFEPPAGHIGLISGAGPWLDVPDGPWTDIFEFVEVTLPDGAHEFRPAPLPEKLEVPLGLASATRSEAPSLWILRSDEATAPGAQAASSTHPGDGRGAIEQIDSLVGSLPDDIIGRLLFAVLGSKDTPVVVLRARHGRAGPPHIDVAGTAMVPLLGIANLYVPHNAIVEPPLRRDTLRELLASDPDRLYWLAPTGDRRFRVESAPDRALSPLSDWVEYTVHRNAEELEPWVRAVTFEFESFQSIGAEWASIAEPEVPEEKTPERRPRTRGGGEGDEADTTPEDDVNAEPVADETPSEVAIRPPPRRPRASDAEVALAALERAFLDSEAAAEAPERSAMWLEMAELLTALERHRDAALCYVRAMWELSGDAAQPIIETWARAQRDAVGLGDTADVLWHPARSGEEPSPDEVRAIAVHWIATAFATMELPAPRGPRGGSPRRSRAMQQVQQFFDRYDLLFDVRTLWLLRQALAAHAGNDVLGLARTRDRILQSLRSGLSLQRDVPTFLRFLGRGAGGDSVAVAQLVARLESMVGHFDKTRRKRSAIEAPPQMTGAYIALVIAYGFARLGQAERAHELHDQAAARLDPKDPIHGFLVRAYSARIEQALEGLPPQTPLPVEVAGELNQLGRMERYKVDRLREISTILEPQERIQAIENFPKNEADPRGEEFAALRGMNPAEISNQIARLLEVAIADSTSLAERDRLLDGIMDFFPMLPDSQAVPALHAIIGAVAGIDERRQAQLLEEALMLAGYFGRDELASRIADSIAALVAEFSPEEATEFAPEFGDCLRSLRRVGLHDQATELINAVSAKVSGDGLEALVARLHLAAGLAYLGDIDRAQPILASAESRLASAELKDEERLPLVRALASAYGECPQAVALRGLGQLAGQLGKITDSLSTNSHFCLSVISFMEALVLGYAKSDLALGEFGRRWLDEDEYLVRRRIHRELGERS